MFRENTQHLQQTLLDSSKWMDKRVRASLEKSWAPIFYEHVFLHINERPFAVLYSDTGAPNVPVNTLLSLEIIKHIFDITDLDLLDRYRFDYLVNYAVGQRTLGEDTFADRSLYYFREKLYTHTMEHPESEDLMFGQFKSLLESFCEKTGQIMGEQRIDTTMFMSNIKKAGRISLLFDVLVKGVRAIPRELLSENLKIVTQPGFKTEILYKSKGEQKESRLTLLLQLGREVLDILKTLPADENTEEKRILERLLTEQAKTDENGQITAKANKEIPANSLQSAYDEDATYRTKAEVSQSGYVLEVAETCSKENPMQFITDYHVEPNTTGDTDILKERTGQIAAAGCTDLYGDGGFYSEEVIEKAKSEGIELHYTEMTGKPTKTITAADFEYNETSGHIKKCPMGQTPVRTAEAPKQFTAHFNKQACSGCPLREQCPHRENKNDVTVRIDKKSVEAANHRKQMDQDRVANTSQRAAIEGSNSALKQKGLRKLRVRGKAKCVIVCGLKVIAQNVKRFIRYMQGGYDNLKKSPSTAKGVVCPS